MKKNILIEFSDIATYLILFLRLYEIVTAKLYMTLVSDNQYSLIQTGVNEWTNEETNTSMNKLINNTKWIK